jgi:hypothetical protein
MKFGDAIDQSLKQLRLNADRFQDRGSACGLLLGEDEALRYENIPVQFRPFLRWGVDGVHEGLWIDDARQAHPPYVVMASPMDFSEPIQIEATNVDEWLGLIEIDDHEAAEWVAAERSAIDSRTLLGLPRIPTEGV